jgi:hypothetical protein
MAKKRMTRGELARARDRAVRMFESFGDSTSAEEFAALSPEEYARRKGIEVIEENPTTPRRRNKTMAQKSKRVEELEDAIEDNHAVATREYTTKAEMQAALDEIAEACVEACPDLGEEEDSDESEGEDEEE